MAKKPTARQEFVLFDIVYEDGTQRSNRKVPADILDRERGIYRGQMEGQNKPAAVIDKIVEGKLNSFFEQVCLLDQPSIRDPKMTIGHVVQAAIAKLGENISIARFVRYKLGESA